MADQKDNETTYRIGVIGDLTDTVSPYISYTESFLPILGQDLYGNAFVPMRGHQVETGVKWQPTRNAMFSAAIYKLTDTNRQTNDPENVLNVVQTGEVQSKGIELEGAYVFDNDFTITASLSHSEAEISQSNIEWEQGDRLNDTPENLASVWLAKGFQVGDDMQLRAGLGGRYVGSTVSSGPTTSIRTPSYTLADALLELQMPEWTVALNVTNLFDKEYFAPCRYFGDCFSGNTRTIVGTVTYRF